MKKRQKERKISKVRTKIERIDKQIIQLDEAYKAIVAAFGDRHMGVITRRIQLEYMRKKLLADRECHNAIISELSK